MEDDVPFLCELLNLTFWETPSLFNSQNHHPFKRNYSKARNMDYGESHPILQSSSLQHWFKNWQELRQHKLTASTFSSAIGFWPRRRVQLWLEKIGAIKPFSGNLATCWGNIKEEEALEKYKLITGNSVTFPYFQVYKKINHEDDWIAASPDQMDWLITVYMVCLLEGFWRSSVLSFMEI